MDRGFIALFRTYECGGLLPAKVGVLVPTVNGGSTRKTANGGSTRKTANGSTSGEDGKTAAQRRHVFLKAYLFYHWVWPAKLKVGGVNTLFTLRRAE